MLLRARPSSVARIAAHNVSSRVETASPAGPERSLPEATPAPGRPTLLSLTNDYATSGPASAAPRPLPGPPRVSLLEFAARNRAQERPSSRGALASPLSNEDRAPGRDAAAVWTPPVKIQVPTKRWELKADKKVWKTTYWPYCASGSLESGEIEGNPEVHLWAEGGCLDKLDQLLRKRGRADGARAHERVPALNFLKNDGSPSGYYVPVSTIREADAERTTGVDFSGDGKLNANVKVDFLGDRGVFGHNGRTDGRLYVGWWGSCDKVALAGLLFSNPKREVTRDGITFSPQDIRGLLTVIADSQALRHEYVGTRFSGAPDRVVLKDGEVYEGRASNISTEDCLRGEFERRDGNRILVRRFWSGRSHVRFKSGGTTHLFPVEDVASLEREDGAEPSASDFHHTLKRWLRQRRPFAMNQTSEEEVWNVNVDKAVITKTRGKSPWGGASCNVGFNGVRGDGEVCFYEASLWADGKFVQSYRYWIEKRDGEDVNSGWTSTNPGFLWRPVASSASPEGKNERNPFVDPAMVMELYQESIGPDSQS